MGRQTYGAARAAPGKRSQYHRLADDAIRAGAPQEPLARAVGVFTARAERPQYSRGHMSLGSGDLRHQGECDIENSAFYWNVLHVLE